MKKEQVTPEVKTVLEGMDYCLAKFFDENFAPILDECSKDILTKAKNARSDIIFGSMGNLNIPTVAGAGGYYLPGAGTVDAAVKTTDDVYIEGLKKFRSQSGVGFDLSTLADGYRAAFLAEFGDEGYRRLSDRLREDLGEMSSGDFAVDYVAHRLEGLYIEKLAVEGYERSRALHILEEGFSGSLLGFICDPASLDFSRSGAAAKELRGKMFDEKWYETIGRKTIELGTDYLTLGGGSVVKFLCYEGGFFLLDQMTGEKTPVSFDEYVGHLAYGDKEIFTGIHAGGRKINPAQSEVVGYINQHLSNKLHLPQYVFSPQPVDFKDYSIPTDGEKDFSITNLANHGFVDSTRQGVPAPVALGEEINYLQNRNAPGHGGGATQHTTSGRPLDTYTGPRGSYVMTNVSQQRGYNNTTQPYTPNKDKMTGWQGFVDMLGLGGMSDLGKNAGYVFAMLPDMLVGLFTGKYRSLNFENSILPISAILMGMFVKNPILKTLLILFGGANLLNKVGHEALDKAGYSSSVRQYRKYDEVALNERVKDVAIKGDTLLATIDGVPQLITIKSEKALDAYYKGYLPINVLANAVLDQYDEQNKVVISNYERGMTEKEEQRMTVGIK